MAFGIPMLVLIPIKVLALFLLGQGHVGMGVGLILVAKLAGTALAARLFQLTQPALMRIRWFARAYTPWKIWKDRTLRQVRVSWPWRMGRRIRHRVRIVRLRLQAALRSAFSSLHK